MTHKILLLDDGESLYKTYNTTFRKNGLESICLIELSEIAEVLLKNEVDIVLVDTKHISENTLYQIVAEISLPENQNLPFIFLGSDIIDSDKFDFSLKIILCLPISPELLVNTIKNVLGEKIRREEWGKQDERNTNILSLARLKIDSISAERRLQSGE
ncbi:hypothetical protein [Algoriphagus winogradskyi]|uniref:Response regulatory domain-containing protein n=1 Tax=Algoriphagus winogradskyi TaxID=237017 RepID=A0ABY1PHX4_9BACT|nr:hypothetical protein [Algoriphagus winogradskyi]SMP33238.1 hypothetical protein SAMN06265367_108155 [Algoriphagus winogradskyi]